ncbi:hypothetical protein [Phascolarctobacterium sp.]|uniref:hypothetical protein n=1 Tax=Phascolarctobacterium sp. TaxID=2049039 RepID=UPI0038630B28
MKAKFKVGDKVRILDGSNICNYVGGFTSLMRKEIGKTFTIQSILQRNNHIGYRMKEVTFTWDERGLELAKNKECIVIYRKGDETIALDKTTGKKAVAKCSPEDTYDFCTGAQLAFKRLTGAEEKVEEQPQPIKARKKAVFNGFVECIKNGHNGLAPIKGFTIGKIYEVKNGVITNDDGWTSRPKTSLDHLCFTVGNTFVEVKKVKRAAKAGEFIEIVAAERVPATNGEPDYKNGDILKVIKTMNMHSNGVTAYYKEGMGKFAAEREYVVLEGYVEPRQLYNGKVVCVDNGQNTGLYTVGKLYKFKDGIMVADNGKKYPTAQEIYSFEDWARWTGSKFIEIKE